MFGLFGPSKNDILEEGREAMATVRNVEDTGTRVNNRPRVKLTLEIAPRGRPSWTIEKKVTTDAGQWPTVGQQISVRFLPEDRERVEIDRGAMEMAQAQIVTNEGTVPASAPEPPPPPAAPAVPETPGAPPGNAFTGAPAAAQTPFAGAGGFGSLQEAIAA